MSTPSRVVTSTRNNGLALAQARKTNPWQVAWHPRFLREKH